MQKRIYNYFERNPQLKVLFVFDKLGAYEVELQDAQWKEEYVYGCGLDIYDNIMLTRLRPVVKTDVNAASSV